MYKETGMDIGAGEGGGGGFLLTAKGLTRFIDYPTLIKDKDKSKLFLHYLVTRFDSPGGAGVFKNTCNIQNSLGERAMRDERGMYKG